MKERYHIKVLTTDTDHGELQPYPGIIADKWTNKLDDKIDVYYAKRSRLSRRQLKRTILEADADVVYLNHIWSPFFVLYPLWLKFTGQIKSKVIVCPRGALYKSALKVKFLKKLPVLLVMKMARLQKYVLFHATNERESVAIRQFFPGSFVMVADNLPSCTQLPLKTIEKVSGSLKCVFVARIVAIKNLLFFLEAISGAKSNITLTVIGPVEEKEYWDKCNRKMAELPHNIEVNYMGAISNSDLFPVIQGHHLFVLPTTGENFGHSIFEAFIAGRPALISDQTPWLSLKQKGIGWDINLSTPEKFGDAIEAAASWDQATFDMKAANAWNFAHNYIKESNTREEYYRLFG